MIKNPEQKIVEKFPVLGSSESPEEISLTIKGAILSLLPFLSMLLSHFGVQQEWLRDLVNSVFLMVGAVITIIGVLRKFKKTE